MKGSHEVSLALQFESKISCLLDCRSGWGGGRSVCVIYSVWGRHLVKKTTILCWKVFIAYLVKLSAIIFVYFSAKIQRLRGSMVEHLSSEQKVAGSSPVVSSPSLKFCHPSLMVRIYLLF